MADHDWTAEVTVKPSAEVHEKLTHHLAVVAQITDIAAKVAALAGTGHKQGDFGIRVQNRKGTKRARAFALPTNGGGIHLELTQSLLVKAAGSTGHLNLAVGAEPSSAATDIAGRGEGEYAAPVTGGNIGSATESEGLH